MLDGIAGWCGGLHGSMPLNETLAALAVGCGATAAGLARHLRGEHIPRTVALFDNRQLSDDVAVLKRPLARDAMGYMYTKSKSATVWFMTDLLDDDAWVSTQTLMNWRLSREIAEIVVISLGGTQNRDFVEFHFDNPLKHSEKLEFEALTPTIVRSWAGRKKGLVAGSLMGGRKAPRYASDVKKTWLEPILSVANPAGLSRSEFRVCLMLSKGLTVRGVEAELGTSEATVRSHLRSIYAKTDVNGMAELLYLILSNDAQDTLHARSA
jgi:DNA-binding CsgD family transcriptional regulator